MAEHPDKPLHVRADTYGAWHTQVPDDSIFESTFGQITYAQSHHLSAETYDSRQQDAVGCPVSSNLSLPVSVHLHHPMRWAQNPRSDSYGFSSIDSEHVDFGSDLEPTKLEAKYDAVNYRYTEAFKHQPTLGQVEPLAFDMRSPISGL